MQRCACTCVRQNKNKKQVSKQKDNKELSVRSFGSRPNPSGPIETTRQRSMDRAACTHRFYILNQAQSAYMRARTHTHKRTDKSSDATQRNVRSVKSDRERFIAPFGTRGPGWTEASVSASAREDILSSRHTARCTALCDRARVQDLSVRILTGVYRGTFYLLPCGPFLSLFRTLLIPRGDKYSLASIRSDGAKTKATEFRSVSRCDS